MVQDMSFRCISYLELWRPLCSAKQIHLCNFGRGIMRNRFGPVFSSIFVLMYFLSRALAAPLFSRASPFVQFWKRHRDDLIWTSVKQDIPLNVFLI